MNFVISNGLTFLGANFFTGPFMDRFFVDNHTLSPILNGLLFRVILCAICCLLSSCAARASSRKFFSSSSHFSTAGAEVLGIAVGIATGSVPYMSLNGDICLASCVR